MREFAKSVFSFSWVMSLFGLQQTVNLVSSDRSAKAAGAFDSVTEATQAQLGEALKKTFDVGDKLQQRATDMALGLLSGQAPNPNEMIKMTSDAAKQSADALTQGVRNVTSTVRNAASASAQTSAPGMDSPPGPGGSCSSQRQGWGPAPP